MRINHFNLIAPLFVLGIAAARAQMYQPVKWHFSAVAVNDQEADIIFTANVDDGWHIYVQNLKEGGPVPTTFTFDQSDSYSRIDFVKDQSTPLEKFDQTFMMPVAWFEKTAVFTQRIKLNQSSTVVKGKVMFMACSEYQCLLPEEKEFSVEVKAVRSEKKTHDQKPGRRFSGKKKSHVVLN